MKLFVTAMLSMLFACTQEAVTQSEPASDELAALGVDEVHRTAEGYQLLEDGNEVGEIRFSPGVTSTTLRGDHHELRVGADGVSAVCNGARATLAAEGATGLDALDACQDATRVTGLLIDPDGVPALDQSASLQDCRLIHEAGCTSWIINSDGWWYCTQHMSCLCDTCSGNCLCTYSNW